MNNIFLILLDALRTWSLPTGLEFVGFLLGLAGGMCFVFKEPIYKVKDLFLRYIC